MKSASFAPPGQQGFSLVELMISVTIGLLLVAAMGTLVANNSAHRQEVEQASRQIENGRYAVQVLSEDLHHAGFYGEYGPKFSASTNPPIPASWPNPCTTTPAALDDAMPFAVQGYDAPAALPGELAACLDATNWVAGSDILLVRRAATVTTAFASLTAGKVYLQSRPSSFVLNDGSAGAAFTLTQKDNTTLADIRQYIVHVYFLSPCSVPSGGANCSAAADDGKPIPTLKRLELTDDGAGGRTMRIVPMVEGIEALEIDYGIDNAATGTPDTYKTIPASLTEWSNVVAARIQLVARNHEASPGYVDAKTYDMGLAGTYTPTALTFKRHAYTQLVRLVNPSSRREE